MLFRIIYDEAVTRKVCRHKNSRGVANERLSDFLLELELRIYETMANVMCVLGVLGSIFFDRIRNSLGTTATGTDKLLLIIPHRQLFLLVVWLVLKCTFLAHSKGAMMGLSAEGHLLGLVLALTKVTDVIL